MNIYRITILTAIVYLSAFNLSAQERRKAESKQEKIRETSVSMTPPQNFVQSEEFTGFMDEASGVSIIVFDKLDIASSIYAAKLDEEYFNSQGLELKRKEMIESDNRKEYLFECTTVIEGIPMYRLFFITGDTSHTIISVTNILAEVYDEIYTKVYKSLLSIKYEK
ncbi:hypothetical protein QA597_01340 [Marinilabiliaceae bacterium ANBcel2]|nr:hypothetical protein [Marinilabiliaceae bacterium ANBcel2]